MRPANYRIGMEDRDIVAAVVAGDPAGLAEAYDRYAVPLYAYSCSMLGEPADAADAVQDAFLIAAARLRGLRDPDKLRPWLYAVARNECLRRLRAAARTVAGLDEAHDLPAAAGDPGQQTEQADLRELVRDAIDGLNPGERDVIELSLGHDLDGDDLADALGVSRNHAHALLSRARSQLERSLGALIVARAGRAACAALDTMLAGWDGRLTVLMRKRIGRHIERCEVCGERKRRELSPALFAGMVPLAAVLPGFRDQLLRTMADRTPAGMAHRLAVANRAGPFGPAGFPRPIRLPAASAWRRARRRPLPHSHAVVTGAATLVAAAGVIAVVVMGGLHHASAAAPGTTHGTAASPGAPSPAHGGPTAGGRSGLLPLAAISPGVTSPGALGAPGTSGAAGASGTAGTPGAPGASSTAPAGSSSSAAATPPAASSTPAPTTASQGTLASSTGTVHLVSVNGTKTGTFTITANGGPVSDYSITVGSAVAGKITVSPATGSLASGASATITVSSASLVALDGTLTIDPGGRTVAVVLAIGL
jgi:RNA polymerase sigma factor (sigma-70 family)